MSSEIGANPNAREAPRPIYVNVMTADKRPAPAPTRVVYLRDRRPHPADLSRAPSGGPPVVQFVSINTTTPAEKISGDVGGDRAGPTTVNGVSINANGDNIVIATDGSIVSVGDNTTVTGNTGDANASGSIAVGVTDSTVTTGNSTNAAPTDDGDTADTAPDDTATGSTATTAATPLASDGSSSASGTRATAIAGWENRSIEVGGSDNFVIYEDAALFYERAGDLNGNTGNTGSSGLIAVDAAGSIVGSGSSATTAGSSTVDPAAIPGVLLPPAGGGATVVDANGVATATGDDTLVIGGDGIHDKAVTVAGDRNVVTYDGGNAVIRGTGDANAQIGSSDGSGTIAMDVRDTEVQSGNSVHAAGSAH